MVSVFKTDNVKNTDDGKIIYGELRGLSTEDKPTTIGEAKVGNGSVFVEIDTQKLSFYDEESETWMEV